MIQANLLGRIIKGDSAGWFIKIHDDQENTGGYLVVQSKNSDFSGDGFDNWFETMGEVERFLKYKNWKIEWLE